MTGASVTHAAVTVGNTSTAVLGANIARKLLILQNVSNETIHAHLAGAVAMANQCLSIPAGAAWTFDAAVPTGAVTAICASGGKTLVVSEGT
jgi:hypothetical protein